MHTFILKFTELSASIQIQNLITICLELTENIYLTSFFMPAFYFTLYASIYSHLLLLLLLLLLLFFTFASSSSTAAADAAAASRSSSLSSSSYSLSSLPLNSLAQVNPLSFAKSNYSHSISWTAPSSPSSVHNDTYILVV